MRHQHAPLGDYDECGACAEGSDPGVLLDEIVAAWDGLLDLPETLISTAPFPEAAEAVRRMAAAVEAARSGRPDR